MRAVTEQPIRLPPTYLTEGMAPEDVARLEAIALLRTYAEGERIITHRDTDCDLMILVSGTAQIVTHVGDPMAEIAPGQVFGEIALIDRRSRSAHVVAGGEASVIVIPGEALLDLMTEHPRLGLVVMTNLARVLCERLRTSNRQLGTLLALAN